jgi:hypothetical protein
MNQTFHQCRSLLSVPEFDTSSTTNVSNLFNDCPTLQSIPALDFSAVTDVGDIFGNSRSLANISITGMAKTFSVQNCRLSAAELDYIYTNLATVTSETITVTGNYGTAADDPSIATAKNWTVTG